jgi:23S rRNA pseudouridine2605 synthase
MRRRAARPAGTNAARRTRRSGAPAAAAPGERPGQPERLQKLLARAGLASRREAEAWIRAGRLTVNGATATLGARAGANDQVRLDGRLVRAAEAPGAARAFVCHRSPGEPLRGPEAAAADAAAGPAARPALLARLPRRAGRRFIAVSPMPRVDGGLELVSADGGLTLRLQRAVHALLSEFSVRVRGELAPEQLGSIRAGVLDSGATLAVERCEAAGGEGSNRWYTLVARGASGKEIRQLFERSAALVSRVLRTRLGPVTLERSLARGQFREVTAAELAGLLAALVPPAPADPEP